MFQRHRRYLTSTRSYPALMSMIDKQQDIGHFWRQGNTKLLECPFNCGGRSHLKDPVRLLGNLIMRPDDKCRGSIKNYAKFAFAGIAEGGNINVIPEWTNLIQKSKNSDQQIQIIKSVVGVSVS